MATRLGDVCIPAARAKLIYTSLRNYEKAKPVIVKQSVALQESRLLHRQDSVYAEGQQKLIDWYKVAYAQEQQLRQDADKKVVLWRGKARRRGLIIGLGIGLPAAYGIYTILK